MSEQTPTDTDQLRAELTALQTQIAQLQTPRVRRVSRRAQIFLALGFGLIAMLIGVGLAVAATTIVVTPDAKGNINACYNTKTGKSIRFTDPTNPKLACKKSETALFWQQKPANVTIFGVIDGSTGNIVSGTGFTSKRNTTGNYTITLPAGTFQSYPAIALTSIGDYPQFVFDGGYSDGNTYVFNYATLNGKDTSFSFAITYVK